MTAVAADFYAPFDAGPGADAREAQWRAFMSRFSVSGALRSVADELQPYADSSGMFVKVKTGECIINGHWGQNTSEKIVPVAPADPTLARVDRIVARANYDANTVEYECVPGTPGFGVPLPLVRNTSMYEIPLGTVNVGAAVSTITSGNVSVNRQWGGPPYPTVTDDWSYFKDKLSSCPRMLVTQGVNLTSGFIYVVRMQSAIEQVVSRLSLYVDQQQVGGGFNLGIYVGDGQRALQKVAAPSLPISGTGNIIKTVTFSPLAIAAGQVVAVGMLALASSTVPSVGCSITSLLGVLSPSGEMVTCFKGSQSSMPGSIDMLDGSWAGRDRVPWVSLG